MRVVDLSVLKNIRKRESRRKEVKMKKIIKESYPRKGVKVELWEHYHRTLCPKRSWKLWVKFKDDRWLEIHGILIDKTDSIRFYNLVRESFKQYINAGGVKMIEKLKEEYDFTVNTGDIVKVITKVNEVIDWINKNEHI